MHSSSTSGQLIDNEVGIIRIGAHTNIQDGTFIHIDSGRMHTYIGDDLTLGHNAVIYACTLKNRACVAIIATFLDGAMIEEGGMLTAGGLLPPGKVIGLYELRSGSPPSSDGRWTTPSWRNSRSMPSFTAIWRAGSGRGFARSARGIAVSGPAVDAGGADASVRQVLTAMRNEPTY